MLPVINVMDLIKKVKQDYNKISDHFSKTRVNLWPEMTQISDCIKKSSKILDIGCGNGRFADLCIKKNANYTGIDISKEMIKNAKQRFPTTKFILSDILDFKTSEKYDLIVCYAMFHHLPTNETRKKALNIIHNLLTNNGIFYMTVWNIYNKKRIRYLINATYSYLTGKTKSLKDTFIPWKSPSGEIINNRYYYAFSKNELKKLVIEAGFEISTLSFSETDANYLTARNIALKAIKKV